ncbi:MAG: hypothetical protein IPI85_10950 [Dehalococcoidia bacterium]|nr:hypothetical protein [Dehalococcoidia bacterium]
MACVPARIPQLHRRIRPCPTTCSSRNAPTEIINAQRSLELGIANRVVAHDDLLPAGLEFCAKLAAGPTATYGRMKKNLNLGETATFAEVLDHEALMMRLSGLSADSREAVRAFVEKREPSFIGE